jgi:hypothetical protein
MDHGRRELNSGLSLLKRVNQRKSDQVQALRFLGDSRTAFTQGNLPVLQGTDPPRGHQVQTLWIGPS